MGKRDSKAAKAAQRLRGAKKANKNSKKAEKKDKKLEEKMVTGDEGVDIDEMLEEFKRQQEEFEKVTIEVVDRPAKRQGATLCASPIHGKRELLMFGGETVDAQYTRFFNDLHIYSLDSDIWRKITSPNSPLPRSGHAMCSHPSGIVLVFGGEFSSPKQTTFYHYGDTWIYDAHDRDWTKVECKKSPSARSGHRLTVWKNYILLFGGFRDLGVSTAYLNDLWAFDIKDYQWHQIEIPQTLVVPDSRSGHSFLPHTDGAALWGGYSKVKATKGLYKGKVHQDAWILRMKSDLKDIKWERRKKPGFAPPPRIGCYMVPHQGRGVLFGGVYDTKETEESLDSVFYNSIHAYSTEANRWFTLSLKMGGAKSSRAPVARQTADEKGKDDLEKNLEQILANLNIDIREMEQDDDDEKSVAEEEQVDEKPTREYPVTMQLPHPRFNASLAVVGDQLFIYGGTWEKGDHDYAFDSLYSVDLGKLNGLKVYWEDLGLDTHASSSEDEDEDDGEELESAEEDTLLQSEPEEESEDEDNTQDETDPDPRPWLPHPKPFETLHGFYKQHVGPFVEWALKQNPDSRGKDLRKYAFELAESRYWERREVVRTTEDQFEEMGAGDAVLERTQARSTRR